MDEWQISLGYVRGSNIYYLRTWIFGFTCLVFKTMYIDTEKPLREGAFFFTRRRLFLPLDKRNTCDKAKGLCISSERYIGDLGVRYLSPLTNRGQDSQQQSPIRDMTRKFPLFLHSIKPHLVQD
ncbi:hypothetical protein HMPREF3185_01826 [Porphyromonas somerae]|uniref:Uncharacterized protein n=1 Tax=Porphyromonas somerae TaxID=322095 RepID=A0A134B220_9PORP|nr:hypothetical protein HMPREF3184_01826 [Porphyromonadaceae bacterium KA00676]KXB73992.1 hypothetical protein HMPREF3185_01826 [Porphyromonas somerae]